MNKETGFSSLSGSKENSQVAGVGGAMADIVCTRYQHSHVEQRKDLPSLSEPHPPGAMWGSNLPFSCRSEARVLDCVHVKQYTFSLRTSLLGIPLLPTVEILA